MLEIPAHAGAVQAIRFFPDGDRFLTIAKSGDLKLWQGLEETAHWPLSKAALNAVAISPDGSSILCGGESKAIFLVTGKDGPQIQKGMADQPILGLAYLNTNQAVAIACGSRTERTNLVRAFLYWDLQQQRARPWNFNEMNGVVCLTAYPKRQLLAWVNDIRRLSVGELGKQTPHFSIGLPADTRAIQFDPDGKYLAVSADWKIYLYDWQNKYLKHTLSSHRGVVTSVDFSPDGKLVFSAGWDSMVRVWDVATGAEIQSYQWPIGRLQSLAVSPDGMRAIAGSVEGAIWIWDL